MYAFYHLEYLVLLFIFQPTKTEKDMSLMLYKNAGPLTLVTSRIFLLVSKYIA